MKIPWVEHYEHCEQCNNATEIRQAEAKDIYDPVGGTKMLRNCCSEGRRLCIEYTESTYKDIPPEHHNILRNRMRLLEHLFMWSLAALHLFRAECERQREKIALAVVMLTIYTLSMLLF